MVIRWLGAYKKKSDRRYSLSDSLDHEFGHRGGTVVCAEKIRRGQRSEIRHAHVGLVVHNRAVVRRFKGDVWSVIDRYTGKRVKTRKPVDTHTEVWCRPEYVAIIVDAKISRRAWRACRDAARRYGVPVLRLTKDGKVFSAVDLRAPSPKG